MDSPQILVSSFLLAMVLSANSAPSSVASSQDVNNRCPQGSNVPFYIYADSQDCSKFYICSHGRNHPKFCPGDLHFSSQINTCVFKGSSFDDCTAGQDNPVSNSGQNGHDDETGQDTATEGSYTEKASTTTHPTSEVAENRCPQAANIDSPFLYADPDDCTKFYMCSHGRNYRKSCATGQHFSDRKQTCVLIDTADDTCEIDQAIRKCREGYTGVIPHPRVCQRYFDCSEPERERNQFEPPYLPFEKECGYSFVFDAVSGQCQSFRAATCSGRSQAGKEFCDYLFTHCRQDPSVARCKPCDLEPSCVGLPDGYNVHSVFPTNPVLYVRCQDEYWMETLYCHGVGVTGYNAELRKCV